MRLYSIFVLVFFFFKISLKMVAYYIVINQYYTIDGFYRTLLIL